MVRLRHSHHSLLVIATLVTILFAIDATCAEVSWNYEVIDLGTAGAPIAITDNGTVAVNIGSASDRKVSAYLYKNRSISPVSGGVERMSSVIGMNESGQIIGTVSRAGTYFPATFNEKGELTSFSIPHAESAVPMQINNFNHVIGSAFFQDPCCKTPTSQTFLYRNQQVEILRHSDYQQLEPVGINSSGSIVVNAISTKPRYRERTLLWKSGLFSSITDTEENHSAVKINDQGSVLGIAQRFSRVIRAQAFLYSNNEYKLIPTLGGNESMPIEMNELNEVVGWSLTKDNKRRAFHYAHHTLTDIGTLGGDNSEALDINVNGDIVGNADTSNGLIHPYLYQNGRIIDLNDLLPPHSEWELLTAHKINNNGAIIGTGNYLGKQKNYLLKPTSSWRRTVVLIHAKTEPGQAVFVRGGIDHDFAREHLKRKCTSRNYDCAIPIEYRNKLNETTQAWKKGDTYLDWYGAEIKQRSDVNHQKPFGTPLDWTTNVWPKDWGRAKYYEQHGYGVFKHNEYGDYYWVLDVNMDCSYSHEGWFEIKSYVTDGPGWESNIIQPDAPYESWNHFAKCGKINIFARDSGTSEARYADFGTTGLTN